MGEAIRLGGIAGTKTGPLSGIRIVECTHYIAGPLGGRLLADQGAECIKVEPTDGDQMRYFGEGVGEAGDVSAAFHMSNRGKLSLSLNARSEAGLEVFKRLLKTADVFISNYRPGVMDSWGCGYDEMRKLNPKIIYVKVSGYGQTGPYSNAGCFDTAIQALSGMASLQGRGGDPAMVQDAIFDKVCAYTVKDAVTSAPGKGTGPRSGETRSACGGLPS